MDRIGWKCLENFIIQEIWKTMGNIINARYLVQADSETAFLSLGHAIYGISEDIKIFSISTGNEPEKSL